MATDSKIDPNFPLTSSNNVKFKRPTTIFDDGEPTDSCIFDAKRVLRLIQDERHLSAEVLYRSVLERVRKKEDGDDDNDNGVGYIRGFTVSRKKKLKRKRNNSKKSPDQKEAAQFLDEYKEIIKEMEERCQLFKRAKKNLDVHDDWTLTQTLFGVTTYYRRESDGSMSIKLEGRVDDCSLFDQVAVIREFDLNHLWAPFVTSSLTVGELDKLDIVGWFLIGLPHFGLMRDALFRAIGCDSIYEDGSVLIYAFGLADRPDENKDREGADTNNEARSNKHETIISLNDECNQIIDELRKDPILDTLDLPPIPTRLGGGRLTIRSVAAQIELESPTSSMTTLIANIDPNMHLLPQVLIDFVMKRMCGTILYKMKLAAKNISKDPITNLHAMKIREEKDFYKSFLLPKFEGMCKIRGWQMPSIAAFDLSDAQLEMAEAFKAKQKQKSDSKALKMFNSNDTDNHLDDYLQSSPDLDDMSDISKFSSASSFWRSNPISNYKRQVEERTQLRKDREIQESRDRAAARLKPKSLDEDAKLRLNELREARNRRKSRKELQVVVENGHTAPSKADQNLRRWKVSVSNHGFFTKIFVLQFLMVSLFCLLYLETAFNKVVAAQEGTFGMERARDIATLTYIGVAGVVHSIFCHIALIYAFSALQLGSIAGKRTRGFYSEYVHHVVAITSTSMVGLGITKPIVDKVLRWLIWNANSTFNFVEVTLLAMIPGKIEKVLHIVVNAVSATASSTQKIFLGSNILSRSIVSLPKNALSSIFQTISYHFAAYVENAIKQYQGDLDGLSWREDAFFTTRALLSHSAFFLLVLLLLFTFSAKQAREAIYVDDNTETSSDKQYSGDLRVTKSADSIESTSVGSFRVDGKEVNLQISL